MSEKISHTLESSSKNNLVDLSTESPLHPDMQAGIENIIHRKIPNAVKHGYSHVGLNNAASGFVESFKTSQIGLTEAGRDHFSGEVNREVGENINAGIETAVANVIKYTQWGISTEGAIAEISNLCKLAQERGITIHFVPKSEGGVYGTEEGVLVTALTNEGELLAFCHDQIERNLAKGVESLLNRLKNNIERGKLHLHAFDDEMDKLIAKLETSGITVIDKNTAIPTAYGTPAPGLVLNHVNKSDIRKLKEEIITSSLANGVAFLVENCTYNISTGSRDPLKGYNEAIHTYITEAEKRGVIDKSSPTLINGKFFNPDLLEAELHEVVKKNVVVGIEKTIDRTETFIRNGDTHLIAWQRETLAEYLKMAEDAGFHVENTQDVWKHMDALVSAENLQAAVGATLQKIKNFTRSGDIHLAKFLVEKTHDIRSLAHSSGLDGQIDFSVFDDYVNELKLNPLALEG